jgi:hypothetical protein
MPCRTGAPRLGRALAAAAALTSGLGFWWPASSFADVPSEAKEQANGGAAPESARDPFRGSTLLIDQSITTPTAHVGLASAQSDLFLYAWWLSLRPRWNFTDKLRVQARFDYNKELTNSQPTTDENEDVFGDIWTDVVYGSPLAAAGTWQNTKVTVGGRAIWPVSKASYREGVYVTLGGTTGISQKIPLRGPDAPLLNGARLGLTMTYLHPFSDSTTPNFPGFTYTRVDTDLRSFASNQLSGQTLANHTLYGILDAGLDITPKLSALLDVVLINQWHYAPTTGGAAGCVTITTGPVCPPRVGDQQYVQLTWLVLEADYQVLPALSVGLGYYNLANTIAPDGTVRSLFAGGEHSLLWSPDARFYLDATVNLDKVYEAVTGRSGAPSSPAAPSHVARTPPGEPSNERD